MLLAILATRLRRVLAKALIRVVAQAFMCLRAVRALILMLTVQTAYCVVVSQCVTWPCSVLFPAGSESVLLNHKTHSTAHVLSSATDQEHYEY